MLWEEEYEHDFTRGNKRRVQRACDVCRRRKSASSSFLSIHFSVLEFDINCPPGRCDGSQKPGNKCSTCIDAKLDCTYLQATTKRTTKSHALTLGFPQLLTPFSPRIPQRVTAVRTVHWLPCLGSTNSYVEYLEARLEHTEALVRQLRAELATAHLNLGAFRSSPPMGPNGISSGDADSTRNEGVWADASGMPPDARKASLHILRTALRMLAAPPQPHADDLMQMEIAKKFESISVGVIPKRHFIGKSSGAVLVKAAIDLKADVTRGEQRADGASNGNSNTNNPNPSAYFIQVPARNSAGAGAEWGQLSGGEDRYWEREGQREGKEAGGGGGSEGNDSEYGDGDTDSDGHGRLLWTSRRLQYWTFKPWENTAPRTHKYSFPPPGLAAHLIELYFAHVNVYVPLLHRPTFQRGVDGGLHLRDDGFAAILLLVCAVASRWSNDPLVTSPSSPDGVGTHTADTGRLACGWGWFEPVPLVGNHLFGQATLYALQYYCLAVQFLEGSSAPQACWTLVGVGLRLAQDVGAHRRQSRVEKPTVESELWKRAFWVLVYMDRQISSSLGRPCAIQYDDFDIDPPLEVDDEYWEHPTHPFEQPPGVCSRVASFNALLGLNHILAFSLKILYSLSKVRVAYAIDDQWEEDVAWNLTRRSTAGAIRFQSICAGTPRARTWCSSTSRLRCISPLTALPSLAICTSAACTCANMVDVQRRRKGMVPGVINLLAVFISSIVLLLNVWSGKRAGLVPDRSREISNVHKCMEVVRLCEDQWQTAGLLWDILAELASVGRLPLPDPNMLGMVGTEYDAHQQAIASNVHRTQPGATLPPVPPNARYSSMPPEVTDRILLGARDLQQTFDRPIHDPQLRAPYTQSQHTSFSGAIASASGVLGALPMEPSAFAPTPPPDTWFPPEDPYVGVNCDLPQASRELDDMMGLIDNDTIAMWTNAPTGFGVDDWGNYFSNFSEITQGQQMMNRAMGMNGH
ncbi:fungal-specific transcription factor domain-containing protein [Mycena galopus ATCC 62051]|nr:fungal-specific transcription factor domain-containing protein [Mycena galopus ATCC 62051]